MTLRFFLALARSLVVAAALIEWGADAVGVIWLPIFDVLQSPVVERPVTAAERERRASLGAALPTAFREPPSVSSHRGLLPLTLTATRSSINIGDQPAVAEVYNGAYVTPTLRGRPGDAQSP